MDRYNNCYQVDIYMSMPFKSKMHPHCRDYRSLSVDQLLHAREWLKGRLDLVPYVTPNHMSRDTFETVDEIRFGIMRELHLVNIEVEKRK